MQLSEGVMRVFSDVFGVPRESIHPDTGPEAVETWDSLNHLNLVLALEQEFSVQFEPDEIETLVSPQVVAELIGKKTGVVVDTATSVPSMEPK